MEKKGGSLTRDLVPLRSRLIQDEEVLIKKEFRSQSRLWKYIAPLLRRGSCRCNSTRHFQQLEVLWSHLKQLHWLPSSSDPRLCRVLHLRRDGVGSKNGKSREEVDVSLPPKINWWMNACLSPDLNRSTKTFDYSQLMLILPKLGWKCCEVCRVPFFPGGMTIEYPVTFACVVEWAVFSLRLAEIMKNLTSVLVEIEYPLDQLCVPEMVSVKSVWRMATSGERERKDQQAGLAWFFRVFSFQLTTLAPSAVLEALDIIQLDFLIVSISVVAVMDVPADVSSWKTRTRSTRATERKDGKKRERSGWELKDRSEWVGRRTVAYELRRSSVLGGSSRLDKLTFFPWRSTG